MTTYEITDRVLDEQPTAVCRATVAPADLPAFLGRAFGATAAHLSARGLGPAGMPFARYHRRDDGRFDVAAGFPASGPVPPEGEVEAGTLPGGDAAGTVHTGAYEALGAAYEALAAWVRDHGFELAGDALELYYSEPGTPPAETRTEVVQPYTRRSTT